MKKVAKNILWVLIGVIIVVSIYLKLEGNKKKNQSIVEMSKISGQYYPVRKYKVSQSDKAYRMCLNGFLKSSTDLNVVSETQGRVIKIYKEKGVYVNAGMVIAKVDDQLLRSQLDAIGAALIQLEKDEKRFTRLHEQNAVTFHQLEEIQLNLRTTRAKYIVAKRQLEDTRIKAPVSGIINEMYIEKGDMISGGVRICNLINNSSFKLNIKLTEYELKHVRKSQAVSVHSDVYPDKTFQGKINVISQKAGVGNSFDVEIEIENSKLYPLHAGMYVSVMIEGQNSSSKIFIPRRSVVGSLKDPAVFIINGDMVGYKEIIVGENIDNFIEVVKGLKDGDEIVQSGTYSIYDGARVKIMN